MNRRLGLVVLGAVVLAGAWQFFGAAPSGQTAQPAARLLTGVVRSASGEALEGVTISAVVPGSPVTTSVFTDAQGGYYFPSMPAGRYRVRAQMAGYDKGEATVELAHSVGRRDFTIASTRDYYLHLTGDQLFASWPEDTPARRRMKDVFLRNCTGCHEANIALQNRFDERGWEAIIDAMSRLSTAGIFAGEDQPPNRALQYFKKDLAVFLAEMRGPDSPQPALPPRLTGEATLPVVYEYDVPFESTSGYSPNNGGEWSKGPMSGSGGGIGLHDAQPDREGNLWLSDNTEASMSRTIAKVDGRTGEVTNYKVPGVSGGAGHAHGIMVARDGMVWFTLSVSEPFATGGVEQEADGTPSGRLGRLDPRTGKLDAFPLPRGMAEPTISLDEDGLGNIWASTPKGSVRFDPKTRTYREFYSVTQPGPSYGMTADRHGNGWWTQMGLDIVGFANIETGEVKEFKLPPATNRIVRDGDLSPADLKLYPGQGAGRQQPRRPADDPNSDDIWIPTYASQGLYRINGRTLQTTFYPVAALRDQPVHGGCGQRWQRLDEPPEQRRGREIQPEDRAVDVLLLAVERDEPAGAAPHGRRRQGAARRRVLERQPCRAHGGAHAGRGGCVAAAGTIGQLIPGVHCVRRRPMRDYDAPRHRGTENTFENPPRCLGASVCRDHGLK